MEVPSESFHRSSWDSRTCYARRAFNRGLTDDSKGIGYPSIGLTRHDVTAAHYEWIPATHVVTLIDGLIHDEPTWRCHQNPFIGALGTLCLA